MPNFIRASAAVDSSGAASQIDTTLDLSTGAASGRALVVIATATQAQGHNIASVVVVGGSQLTKLFQSDSSGLTQHMGFFYLLNPPSGTHTIRAAASSTFTYPQIHALLFDTVDQTTPFPSTQRAVGQSSADPATIGVATDTTSLVLAGIATYAQSSMAFSGGSTFTERSELADAGLRTRCMIGTAPGTGATVTASFDMPSTPYFHALFAQTIAHASANIVAMGSGTAALTGDIASPAGTMFVLPVGWRVATDDVDGQSRRMWVVNATTNVLQKVGTVVASGGFYTLTETNPPSAGVLGTTKYLAIFDNWDGNTASVDIRGGPALATLIDL
jgi:hypothetical protein